MSAFRNLFGVLTAPTATYERLRDNPVWPAAAATLIVVALLVQLVVVPKIDFDDVVRTQIETSPREMSESEMDQAVEMGAKFGKWAAWLAVFPGFVIAWALIALLFWVLIRMLGGIDLSFPQSFATTVHSMAPWLIHSLLSLPLALTRTEISAEDAEHGLFKSSVGAFVETDGALQQVLNSVNVFSIWTVLLLGIGFSVTGRVSRGKAMGTAFGLWLVAVAVKAGLASLGG